MWGKVKKIKWSVQKIFPNRNSKNKRENRGEKYRKISQIWLKRSEGHGFFWVLGIMSRNQNQEHGEAPDPLAFPPSYCSCFCLPWCLFLLFPLLTSLCFPSMASYLLLPLFVASRPGTGTTSACHWLPHMHPDVSLQLWTCLLEFTTLVPTRPHSYLKVNFYFLISSLFAFYSKIMRQ